VVNDKANWQCVQEDDDRRTLRLKVNGGHLYYVIESDGRDAEGMSRFAYNLVFVPEY
jgi:hypothetical protein